MTLQVLDPAGRRLRTLSAAVAHPGEMELVWDGTDAAGRALPAGGYFLRLEGAGVLVNAAGDAAAMIDIADCLARIAVLEMRRPVACLTRMRR